MNAVKIVAEIGCNHQGSLFVAKEMIAEAKRCGCDYVKFQKRHLGAIPSEVANKPYISEHSFGETYLDHRIALELDGAAWRELQEYADKQKIGFFGTAFDLPSAEFLVNINVPYLKIGSAQIRDQIFLEEIDHFKICPEIIVSTGMSTEGEILNLLDSISVNILVHTTSSYPCPDNEINLKWITTGLKAYLQTRTFVNRVEEIGLSGHYVPGNGAVEAAAVALGATYIERHFTLDRTWKGTDQACSLEPLGMINVVKAVRQIERAMGDGMKKIMPSEIPVMERLGLKYGD